MTPPGRSYTGRLTLFHEEEVTGAAYFEALAAMQPEGARRTALGLLARVERRTAGVTAPLLARHGLTPRPAAALARIGRDEARAQGGDWEALLAEMLETYPGFIAAFRALEADAPREDRPRLEVMTAHEVAALDFARRARAGSPDATAPLRAFLSDSAALVDDAGGDAEP